MRCGLQNSAHQLMRSSAVQTRFGKEAARSVVEMLSRSSSRSSRIVMLSMLPATHTLKLNLKSRTV